ncbi:MAG: hypothetical protein RIS47_1999 [Bacteroidota bacterium]|jgi:alpha-galactosidase
MKHLYLIGLVLLAQITMAQKFENLALTPPMGWNSWNKFACEVSADLLKQTADAMVSTGMKDAGYQYIVVDDCWHGDRDSLGFIHPNATHFPKGMKDVVDYIHSKGLKFGIYSCAGALTCGGKPAGRGHEYQDAISYAQWGVDYLKYDWCNTEGLKSVGAYTTMRDALYAAGRPVVFSLCEWGDTKPWEWATNVGHLWRTTGDIYNCFDCVEDHGTWKSFGVTHIIDKQDGLRKYAGPGHWNDPDMMEVGNGMAVNEDRAHFSMWAMLAAPLIAGNDLRSMSKETVEILTNHDAIAVNQDSLGIQGFRYSSKDSLETWFKPLKDGSWAVCFFNRAKTPAKVSFNWASEKVVDDVFAKQLDADKIRYKIYDLWTKKERGDTKKAFVADVPAHDVIMLRLSVIKK